MQCNDIQELLSAHLDGVLEPSDQALLDAHLSCCTTCARELEELQMVLGLLHNLSEISPPPGLKTELRKRIEAIAPSRPEKRRGVLGYLTGKGLLRKLSVAATLLIIAGATAVLYGNPGLLEQKDAAVKHKAPMGNSVAMLNKENISGINDVQKDSITDNIKAKSQPSNDMAEVKPDQKKYIDKSARENDLKIVETNSKTDTGLVAPEAQKQFDVAALPGGANSIKSESAAPPDVFGADEEMSSSTVARMKLYSQQAESYKTVWRADINLAVDNPEQAAAEVSGLVNSRGGEVETAGSPGEQFLILTVPVELFDETIDDLEKMGAQDKRITNGDVTAEYNGMLGNLEELERREKSLAPTDTQAIDKNIREIEAGQEQIRNLEELISNATIKIKLNKN
jgi:cytochrome c556